MKNYIDYISVLAGGDCSIGCPFCVGRKIRRKEPAHFATLEKIKLFMSLYKKQTNNLSISGSTSDPLFVSRLESVCKIARKNYRISLHTCAINKLLKFNVKLVDKICISLHSLPSEDLIHFINLNKKIIRISTVYYLDNESIIDDLSLFDRTPADSFTIRKNIFAPKTPKFIKKLELVDHIFNQPIYKYKDKKIAVWDFADANKYIKARYLWPDGKIRRQCYWYNLHNR